MTPIDDLTADELRLELDEARDIALQRLDSLISAVDSGDLFYATAMALAAKPAAHRVKRLKRALTLGVAH